MTTIGIFDSGVGGLALVNACRDALPSARILYVADTAHQPYGQKTAEQVLRYCRDICEFFVAQDAQAILVACSTASAVAVPALQPMFSIPVLGLINEGWIGDALAKTRNGRIGILATTLTTRSGTFARALEKKAGVGVQVFGKAAPSVVDLISEGRIEGDVLMPVLRREMEELLEQSVDTLVIGCTHFNFILESIRCVVGGDVQIINPRDWVVKMIPPPRPSPPHPTQYRGERVARNGSGEGQNPSVDVN